MGLKLHLAAVVGAALLTGGVLGQFIEPPPTTADPNTIKDCTWWHVAASGDTCESVSATYSITVAEFTSYNPSLASGCKFILGNSYCIEKNFGLPPPVTSPTTSAAPTTTGNGVSTPKPTQTGMTGSCAKFHLVKSGDSCAAIQTTYGVSFASLFEWNPALGDNCQFLVPGNYICVGLIGGNPTTTSAGQTTPTNGVATPSPIQTGMTGNCNKFHLVKSGDSCAAIQSTYGVTFASLFAWNPAIGDNCQFIIPGNYICVGLIGGVTTTTTTPRTTPPNGIVTPTPTQTGMVNNCNKFHLVKSGDSCSAIQSTYSIPSYAQLFAWNPALGDNCQFLVPGNYICVAVLSGGSPTTTTRSPTTTTPPNGIVTPTPTQSGMVKNCNKFHLVKGGDSCSAIQSTYGVGSFKDLFSWNPALGDNCQFLVPGNYICVGVVVATTTTKPPATTTRPGNGINTPTPIQSGMTTSCNKFHLVKSGDSCAAIQSTYGVGSFKDLFSWNPALGDNCQTLVPGNYICVGVLQATITPKPPATTTRPGNGINTPTPIQSGMTTNCNKFHLVKSGDSCAAIQSTYGVGSYKDLFSWNPALGDNCQTLVPGNYICVGVVGSKTTTKAPTTTRGNGVTTPTPTQPGMVTNCKTFHKVVKGDTCQTVADKYRITLANFTRWNSGVGSDCKSLQLNTYACVGLI